MIATVGVIFAVLLGLVVGVLCGPNPSKNDISGAIAFLSIGTVVAVVITVTLMTAVTP